MAVNGDPGDDGCGLCCGGHYDCHVDRPGKKKRKNTNVHTQ